MAENTPNTTSKEAPASESNLLATAWHALEVEEVLDKLGCTAKGLDVTKSS